MEGTLVLVSCLVFLLAVGVARYYGPDFRRPIQTDELITLQDYTWAGVSADGTRNELRTEEEIDSLPQCSLRRFVIGCWSSVGRWTEPNNQIVHSLLVNVSLAVIPDTLSAIRFPALLAAIGYSVICALICVRAGWLSAAPLVTVATFCHPYVVSFSQESRGYALMLFLCSLTLLCLQALWRRPGSLWIHATMTATSVALLVTIVSMTVDWVLPVYLAVGLYCYLSLSNLEASRRMILLRCLALQLTFVIFAAGLFVCDRLPYLVSSAAQYGNPINSLWEAGPLTLSFAHYLFPTLGWQFFGMAAAVGAVLAFRDAECRPILFALLAVMIFSLLHFVVGRRFPYERNVGYLLIPATLGFAHVLSIALRHATSHVQRVGVFCGGLVLVLAAVGSTAFVSQINDLAYQEIVEALRRDSLKIAEEDLLLTGQGVPEPLRLSLDWVPASLAGSAAERRRIVLIQKKASPFVFEGPDGFSLGERLRSAAGSAEIETSQHVVWSLPLARGDGGTDVSDLHLAVWSVPFSAVAVSPEPVLEALHAAKLSYYPINRRYQAKMQVFSRLELVVIPLVPHSHGNPLSAKRQSVEQLLAKFGGDLDYFSLAALKHSAPAASVGPAANN